MPRHVIAGCAVAALVAAAGCAPRNPGASVSCSPPECATDSTLLLVAEVDPPSDSQLVRQEFSSVAIDPQTGLFTLALDQQVTLTGTVMVGAGDAAKPIASTVVATRPSRILGRPDVVYQGTVNPIDGTYTLAVSRSLPGEKYTLRVASTDTSLVPPKTLPVLADTNKIVDVSFDAPMTLPEIHGTIIDSLQQPVAGMQVQATTVATSMTPAVVVSTTTVTDANGAYSIRLVSNPPDKVMLTATPTMLANVGLPSLQRAIDSTKLGPTSAVTATMMMPPLPTIVHVSYNVVGNGTSGTLIPVTAATCSFSADVSDPHATDGTTATFRTTAMTDSVTGVVAVDLIPSSSGNRTYMLTVSPDPTQVFATTSLPVTVAQGGYGPDIVLGLRSQMSGRVLDPDGKALKNLMVVPAASTVSAALLATPFAVATTPTQANAGTDGRFSLRIDPGIWDIGLVPAADAMLPRLWLTQEPLESDLDIGTVTMPRGVIVHGVVHDPSGAPLAHANVRIYTSISGNADCPPADQQCLAPPRLRAESSSGTDGTVSLILPSEPKD
jgi:hypothetical protein